MDSSARIYKDILEDRRKEYSNFMWTSRAINPQLAYKQNSSKPNPQYHKEQVLKSGKIQQLLVKINELEKTPIDVLENQVRIILDEIGYNRKWKVIRWIGLVVVKICQKILNGIYINQSYIQQIRSNMGNCPVVFVPSHRSYADFILMDLLLFTEDIAIPAIAAGMDFHGMWGMGTVLRDTGAFFMRRSYNNDSLYWSTFKQYVYQIVTKGDLPLEFFIEGTRSRSNKSLAPKYGLILMILKALFLSEVPDILFVPINISYDRVLEEELFAYELLGIPKPKESTSGFVKSLKIVKEKYGTVYFHFAEPISAKAYFGQQLDRSVHNLKPLDQQEVTEDEKKLIPSLAHEIIYRQQKHCCLTTFNLIAILLDNNLTNSNTLLTLNELQQEILWLKKELEEFGAYIDCLNVEESIKNAFKVHKNLICLNNNQQLILVFNDINLDNFNPKKWKAHNLSGKTTSFSVPFVMLQLYINPVLHYLIDAALLIIILKNYQAKSTKDELFGHYHFLRSLFNPEFVTFNQREKTEFESALNQCIKLDLIHFNDSGFYYELGNNRKLQQILITTLDCFTYTYYTTCCILQKAPNVCDEKTILSSVQAEIEREMEAKTNFVHPYALNLDTLANCLNSLCTLNVLRKSRRSGDNFYEIDKDELVSVINKLELCTPSAQILQNKLESIHLHLKNKL